MAQPSTLEDLRSAVAELAKDDCAADADKATMRKLGQCVRDVALEERL